MPGANPNHHRIFLAGGVSVFSEPTPNLARLAVDQSSPVVQKIPCTFMLRLMTYFRPKQA
jgi:hypothetical protein